MKFVVLPFFTLMLSLFTIAGTASADSNLEISTTSSFSVLSTNFSGGQTIFVRLASDLPSMAQSKLNVRDNEYNLVNSFNFQKEGSYFSAVVAAPYDQGYYSLEAIVKNNDSNTTSVKTIKVGNPTGANVRVNVHSSAIGSEVLGESNRTEGSEGKEVSEGSNVTNGVNEGGSGKEGGSGDYMLGQVHKSFLQNVTSWFREIADFLWPF